MLPSIAENLITRTEPTQQHSLTYRLDFSTKRIVGRIDGVEAVVQAVAKIMQTERFAYEIYNAEYGIELESLIGKESLFAKSVLVQRIHDALLADKRIMSIDNFTIEDIDRESIAVGFLVNTIYGAFDYREEVVSFNA